MRRNAWRQAETATGSMSRSGIWPAKSWPARPSGDGNESFGGPWGYNYGQQTRRVAMKFRASAWTMLFTTSLALAQVAGDIPAYHKTPPAKGQTLAPILTTSELASQGYAAPVQVAAYL